MRVPALIFVVVLQIACCHSDLEIDENIFDKIIEENLKNSSQAIYSTPVNISPLIIEFQQTSFKDFYLKFKGWTKLSREILKTICDDMVEDPTSIMQIYTVYYAYIRLQFENFKGPLKKVITDLNSPKNLSAQKILTDFFDECGKHLVGTFKISDNLVYNEKETYEKEEALKLFGQMLPLLNKFVTAQTEAKLKTIMNFLTNEMDKRYPKLEKQTQQNDNIFVKMYKSVSQAVATVINSIMLMFS